MPGNVRIANSPTFDQAFLNQALGRVGAMTILTGDANGTVEVNMTTNQLNLFQTLFPQYPVSQVTPVPADEPVALTYEDQAPPAPDTALEGGQIVTPDPSPN